MVLSTKLLYHVLNHRGIAMVYAWEIASGSEALWMRVQTYAGVGNSILPHGFEFKTLVQLRLGRVEAQEQYLAAFWPVLEHEVRRYSHKGGCREELQAEAALALWEAAFQYQPTVHRTSVSAFVANRIHQKVRKSYLQAVQPQSLAFLSLENVEASSVDPALSAVELKADLDSALLELPKKHQTALKQFVHLAVDRGLTLEEAAQQLTRSQGGTPSGWKKKVQRLRHQWFGQLYRRQK